MCFKKIPFQTEKRVFVIYYYSKVAGEKIERMLNAMECSLHAFPDDDR
jgi:hypothetical protein